ncbi:MAG: glucose-6-phosphate isomerase, partial [Spirochaetia bacterium]|nr:glucose-6-phosphate isomerase [Spirochaetia bacterium]
MNTYKSIESTTVWAALHERKPENLRETLTADRVRQRLAKTGGGLTYSYAAMDVDEPAIDLLASAAAELDVLAQYREVATGSIMNIGEKRMVLHHLLRGEPFGPVIKDGHDYGAFYRSEQARAGDFARRIRSGALRGSTGKRFERVVQIGIGGSDLGPRALYLALEQWARERNLLAVKASFISN